MIRGLVFAHGCHVKEREEAARAGNNDVTGPCLCVPIRLRSYSIVKVYEDQFGEANPDMQWEPKVAFTLLAYIPHLTKTISRVGEALMYKDRATCVLAMVET